MHCRVIGISRAMGAGGEEIARLVSEALGFRLIDDEIIVRAAEKAGVTPESMSKVERSASLIDRILKYMGTTSVDAGYGPYIAPVIDSSASYEGIITSVIRETAAAGNVVILAHGASIPLTGTPGLMRVLVTGSVESRATRMTSEGLDAGKVKKQVDLSDAQRREYLQRFYDVRQESPTLYDLVVNTDNISPTAAAALIIAAARG
ncbi:MAG TPA: cytidylate kinase-like family protein [Dehalococcoidia bacterium]|nr:cytidylate kinase-like family protein [Dehalococcoidia bacterium]